MPKLTRQLGISSTRMPCPPSNPSIVRLCITDVREWQLIPTQWQLNKFMISRSGYLALRQTHAPVPLLVPALCRMRPCVSAIWRHKFFKVYNANAAKDAEEGRRLIQELLADHPGEVQTRYLQEYDRVQSKMEQAKKKREASRTYDRPLSRNVALNSFSLVCVDV